MILLKEIDVFQCSVNQNAHVFTKK